MAEASGFQPAKELVKGVSRMGEAVVGEDMSGRFFVGCSFRNADLRGVSLRGSAMWGCDLRGARLDGCDLSGLALNRGEPPASADSFYLHGMDSFGMWAGDDAPGRDAPCQLELAEFTGCDLSGAYLGGAVAAEPVAFRDCALRRATFSGARTRVLRFEGCDLRGAGITPAHDWKQVAFARCRGDSRTSLALGISWSGIDVPLLDRLCRKARDAGDRHMVPFIGFTLLLYLVLVLLPLLVLSKALWALLFAVSAAAMPLGMLLPDAGYKRLLDLVWAPYLALLRLIGKMSGAPEEDVPHPGESLFAAKRKPREPGRP